MDSQRGLARFVDRQLLLALSAGWVQHRLDGVEISEAVFGIRLNIVAFGPLVPCLQQDDAPLLRLT